MTRLRIAGALVLGAIMLGAAGAALSASPDDLLPEAPGKAIVLSTCTACHDSSEITTRHMSGGEWERMVLKMKDLGASLEDKDQPVLVAYLAKNFGVAPAAPDASAPAAAPAPAAPSP
jgi:hypothetical protein